MSIWKNELEFCRADISVQEYFELLKLLSHVGKLLGKNYTKQKRDNIISTILTKVSKEKRYFTSLLIREQFKISKKESK